MLDNMASPIIANNRHDDSRKILNHTRAMQRRYQDRDSRWDQMRAIRMGKLEGTPFDEYVSDFFDKPIISNTIDVVARDLAEMLAVMPAINCSSATMSSDTERSRADKRTKIATHYFNHSRMAEQMLYSCDHYFSYSYAMAYVEPDYKAKMPRIVWESPWGGYCEFDRWNRLLSYTKRWYIDAGILADLYPEYADKILKDDKDRKRSAYGRSDYDIRCEMIRFSDKDGSTLVYGGNDGKGSLILDHIPNVLNKMMFVPARKPWLESYFDKGQFDDAMWTQLAKDLLAKLQFEITHKVTTAPIAVPNDVQELPYGPDALIRTATPEKVRRVGMEMSNMTFIENQSLTEELREGSRYPAVRAGVSDASVITGRGVQALSGGLESQIKAGQVVMREALIDLIGLCFEMDEKLWGHEKKEIKGSTDGTPYSLTYTPAIDIKGRYDADVQYGFAAGLDANRATVLLLQMRADNVISRDYMARQAPFQLNVTEEQNKILQENINDSLMQGVYMLAQSFPAMAQAGIDPSENLVKVAEVQKLIQKGKPVAEAILGAWAPKEPPASDEVQQLSVTSGQQGAPPAGPGGAAELTQAPPQGADVMTALAGLTQRGQPNLRTTVQKRRAI